MKKYTNYPITLTRWLDKNGLEMLNAKDLYPTFHKLGLIETNPDYVSKFTYSHSRDIGMPAITRGKWIVTQLGLKAGLIQGPNRGSITAFSYSWNAIFKLLINSEEL